MSKSVRTTVKWEDPVDGSGDGITGLCQDVLVKRRAGWPMAIRA